MNGRSIGKSQIRTWPEKSDKLRFFVIGDYGSGDSAQRSVADAMIKEFQRLSGDNPVRFVITAGDNIYGTLGFMLRFNNTGDKDSHWESRFFRPYQASIAKIPFYPCLGNHDGNETENRADLAAYLDNFFFPAHVPSRYYRFSYGGLADFFALDSTTNSESGPPRLAYSKDGEQFEWLKTNLGESRVPWKIPYMHHPPFNAGPRHPAVAQEMGHFLDLFKRNGVKVSFSGNEHNFQFSKKNAESGNIRYVFPEQAENFGPGIFGVYGRGQHRRLGGSAALLIGRDRRTRDADNSDLRGSDRMDLPIRTAENWFASTCHVRSMEANLRRKVTSESNRELNASGLRPSSFVGAAISREWMSVRDRLGL